jgi:hypothetical protein
MLGIAQIMKAFILIAMVMKRILELAMESMMKMGI